MLVTMHIIKIVSVGMLVENKEKEENHPGGTRLREA